VLIPSFGIINFLGSPVVTGTVEAVDLGAEPTDLETALVGANVGFKVGVGVNKVRVGEGKDTVGWVVIELATTKSDDFDAVFILGDLVLLSELFLEARKISDKGFLKRISVVARENKIIISKRIAR
jgi:hypothetical protein